MVDKDLNEIRVLQTYFPGAHILVCAFHVIKYLKTASRKPEYGKISNSDHDDLDAIIHNMVYAQNKLVYMENHSSLKSFCQRTQFGLFYEYLEKNWNNDTKKWVLYERAKLPHFAVHTNNHLENWFGHFKKLVKPDMAMVQCIEAVIGCDLRSEQEYNFRRNRVGFPANRSYDREMSQVLRFTTHFVAEHVEKQYIQAMSKVNQFSYDTSHTPGCVVVKDKYADYTVVMDTYECSCAFACSMKLPCQHAIAYRKFINAEWCIPLSRIHQRWMKSTDEERVKQRFVFKPFSAIPTSQTKLSSRQKYKEAVSALQVVCSELADIQDDNEYREHLEFVLAQWRNVRQRKRVRLNEPGTESASLVNKDGKEAKVSSETGSTLTRESSQSGDSDDECDDLVQRVLDDKRVKVNSDRKQNKTSTLKVRIALNPHVVPSGRPRLVRTEADTSEKKKRALFNASERHRRELEEVSIVQLSTSLDDENPNLSTTMKRIDSL